MYTMLVGTRLRSFGCSTLAGSQRLYVLYMPLQTEVCISATDGREAKYGYAASNEHVGDVAESSFTLLILEPLHTPHFSKSLLLT